MLFPHHIEGIMTIGLLSLPSIDIEGPISGEDCPLSVFFAKGISESLPDTVQVLAVHLSANLNIPIAEQEVLAVGRKKHSSVSFARDFYVEG